MHVGGHFLDFILRGTWQQSSVCFLSIQLQCALHLALLIPKHKHTILCGIQNPSIIEQFRLLVLLIFFHTFVSTFPCSTSNPHRVQATQGEPVVLAAELPEVVDARHKVCGVRMCSYRLMGSTVHGNSFWKRATATARMQLSVFV